MQFVLSRRTVPMLLVVVVAAASPAAAQVCSEPANLTSNCGFDVGITGWQLDVGLSFAYSTGGHDAPGSAQIQGDSTMGVMAGFSQCLNSVSAGSHFGYGYWVRVVSGTVETCSAYLSYYDQVGCTDYLSYDQVNVDGLGSSWTWIGSFATPPAGTSSASVSVYCWDPYTPPFVIRVDDVYVGVELPSDVFSDGFEGGTTGRWSLTTS